MNHLTDIYNETVATLNVSGQTLALQHHLSNVAGMPVSIIHFEQSTMIVGLELEDGPLSYVLIGLHAPEPDYSDPYYDFPPDPADDRFWGDEDSPGEPQDDPFDDQPVDEVHVLVSLYGESESSFGVDYKVIVPAGANLSLLTVEINKYRLAGKIYNIEVI